jgi:hypothetical protein
MMTSVSTDKRNGNQGLLLQSTRPRGGTAKAAAKKPTPMKEAAKSAKKR